MQITIPVKTEFEFKLKINFRNKVTLLQRRVSSCFDICTSFEP